MKLHAHQKMMLYSYSDPEFQERSGEFQVLLNPEKYSMDYEVQFAENQSPGTSGRELTFERIKPQKLEFEFLFDRTGAIPDSGKAGEDGVQIDIDKLREITLGYDGKIHRTRYLMLNWGKLLFKCCLTTMRINYKLFKSDGTPLRATVTCQFEEFKESEQRVAEENSSSPDLTHMRIVQRGDTLPLMCYRIYGESKYYLEVAKANELTHFRNLQIGQKIYFPPIEK